MFSFDVFDTVITRRTATPQGVFAIMKDKLIEDRMVNGLSDYVIDNFYELRIHSEELIRKSGDYQNIEEVGLKDIYTAMAVCGCLSESQIDYLCCLEQKTEVENVVGIKENIQLIKKLLSMNEHVVLISDMYLSKKVIREMLLQVDIVFKDIPLYVSSEYGKRKTTGNLYREVQRLEKINFNDWIHIGDNIHQDIEIPFSLGIQVKLWKNEKMTDFENKIINNYGGESELQKIIGTGLNVCQERKIINIKNDIIDAYLIGCRYSAPLLYSYAEWIITQAINKHIQRLYFIARDGYLVKKIVDIILADKGNLIETYYIYGSRKTWRMASLSKDDYNLYQLILWSHVNRINTLRDLASVLHMPLKNLYDYLPGTYKANKEYDSITNQELEYIVGKLSLNEEFINCHLNILADEKKLVQEYLKQEINMQDDNFAFVDVSGGGLTQGCLWKLLNISYEKPIRTFFFKVDRVNLMKNSITDTFMPGFLENNLTIEMICRAPHGQTKGYKMENGKIVPVLENIEVKALLENGFYEYEKGILDYTKKMCNYWGKEKVCMGKMKYMLMYLQYIAHEPSKDVLEYFSSMPSCESGRDNEVVEYAPKLTREDIENIFLKRSYEDITFYYKGTDLNYSLMRATPEEKNLVDEYIRKHDSILGKLCRQDKEKKEKAFRVLYGNALFYPIRLLEEKVILYGAGRFGQNLFNRLRDDEEHQIVLWVDKNAIKCREKGLSQVQDVSEIIKVPDVQIVIGVATQNIANEIRNELMQMEIDSKRIVWIQPYYYPNLFRAWKTEGIG